MHLRPATPADLSEIARLHEANWRRDYAGILPRLALGQRLSDYMAEKWQPDYLAQAHVHVARERAMGPPGAENDVEGAPDANHLRGDRPAEAARRVAAALAAGSAGAVGATGEGRLLGFSAVIPDPDGGLAFLDNLHVDAQARAMGVGRALMSAVAVLSLPGALCLEVLSANRTARAIYRRWGGQEGPQFQDRILGVPVPAHRVDWPDTGRLVDRLRGDRA